MNEKIFGTTMIVLLVVSALALSSAQQRLIGVSVRRYWRAWLGNGRSLLFALLPFAGSSGCW